MATDPDFVKFVADQLEERCGISYRMMFGEYALYSNGKVVALVCNNQLFIKPTEAGRSYIGDVIESPPYPGAKPSFLVQDQIEDGEWLSELIVLTEQHLPVPKPKARKKKPKR